MTGRRNPLLLPASERGSFPDFGAISLEHYREAFQEGFARQLEEIARIVTDPRPADFDNTLRAWERSGELLQRTQNLFYTVSAADASEAVQELEEWLAPRAAAHSDAIMLDAALFARVSEVLSHPGLAALPAEHRYLTERRHREMLLAGAGLADGAKETLRALNAELSSLTTRFERLLLADTNARACLLDDDEIAGLSSAEIDAAARAARERGLAGGYLVALPLPTGHPFLASLSDPEVRARILRASLARGRDIRHDTGTVLLRIVRLRAERAELLGFPSHAHEITADETAGSPENVARLLRGFAPAVARNVAREAEERRRALGHEITASDWAFATERLREQTLRLDTAALRPWFEAERVLRDGVFYAANRLYGLRFSERPDLRGYHDDVRVYDVHEEDGRFVGHYLLDLYARPTKRGGAWMNSIEIASRLRDTRPIVVNNVNVPQPTAGLPTLLTLDEVSTLFHEFGHALHGLLADVEFPRFAGTNVFRDFVEYPSQVNEMWMLHPEILPHYAIHHETGAPLPREVAESLRAAGTFNQGFATSEYLQAAWLDQAWHSLSAHRAAAIDDVDAFESAALAEIGLLDERIPPRYPSRCFAHVFAGGYSAAYYSYIWSEVLDADTVAWFEENGGLTRTNGERFRRAILSIGGSRDPLEAYREFRGREADIGHLLRRRGLAES